MSDVVIRCPNCGTTGETLGECEACHEGDVRYFCTNHEPGRWLDGSECRACGARYGVERAKSRPAPRPSADPPVARRTRPLPPDEPELIPVEVWTGPVHTPETGEVFGAERGLDPRVGWRTETPFGPGTIKLVSASGCVRRLVMLVVLLLILAALAVFGVLGVGARLLFGAERAETTAWQRPPVAAATTKASDAGPRRI